MPMPARVLEKPRFREIKEIHSPKGREETYKRFYNIENPKFADVFNKVLESRQITQRSLMILNTPDLTPEARLDLLRKLILDHTYIRANFHLENLSPRDKERVFRFVLSIIVRDLRVKGQLTINPFTGKPLPPVPGATVPTPTPTPGATPTPGVAPTPEPVPGATPEGTRPVIPSSEPGVSAERKKFLDLLKSREKQQKQREIDEAHAQRAKEKEELKKQQEDDLWRAKEDAKRKEAEELKRMEDEEKPVIDRLTSTGPKRDGSVGITELEKRAKEAKDAQQRAYANAAGQREVIAPAKPNSGYSGPVEPGKQLAKRQEYYPRYEEPSAPRPRPQLSDAEIARRNLDVEPMFDEFTYRDLERLRTNKKFTLPELQIIDDLIKRYSDIIDINIELGKTTKENKARMISFVIANIEKQGTKYILSLQRLVETNEANFKKKLEDHRAKKASRFAPAIVSEKDLLRDILRNNVTKDPAELDSFATEAERAIYVPPKEVSGESNSFFDISLTRTVKVTSENNNQTISIEGSPTNVTMLPGNTYVVTNTAILEVPKEGLVKEASNSTSIPKTDGPIIQATLSVRNDGAIIVYRRIVNRREARVAKTDKSVGITEKNAVAKETKEIKDANGVFEEYEIDVGQDFSSNKKPIKYNEFLDLLRKVGAQNIVDLILEYERLLKEEIPKGRMTEAEVIPTIYTDLSSLLKTARIDQIKTYIVNARAEIQKRDKVDSIIAEYAKYLDRIISSKKITAKRKPELLETLNRQIQRLGIDKVESMIRRIIAEEDRKLAKNEEREADKQYNFAIANELDTLRERFDISNIRTAQDLATRLQLGQLKMDIDSVRKMLEEHETELSQEEIDRIDKQLFDAEDLVYQLERFQENISKFSIEDTQELLFWLKTDSERIYLGDFIDSVLNTKMSLRPVPEFFEKIGGSSEDWKIINAWATEHKLFGEQRVKFLLDWKYDTPKNLRSFIEDYVPEDKKVEVPKPVPLEPLPEPELELHYNDPELERVRQDNERRAQMLDLMQREHEVRGSELVDVPKVDDLEYERKTAVEASEKLARLKEQLLKEAQEARAKRTEEYKKQEPLRQQIAQDYDVLQNIVRLVSALAPEKRKEYYQALDKILRDTKSSDLETNVNAHRYTIIAFRPFIETALDRFNIMFSNYEKAQTNKESSQIEWAARILESIKPRLTQFTEYKDILPKLEKALTIKNNYVSLRRAKALTIDFNALTTMDLRDVNSIYSLRSRYRFQQMEDAFLEFDKLWTDLTLNGELSREVSQELLDSIEYPRRYHLALKTIFDNPLLFNKKILDLLDILRYSLTEPNNAEQKSRRIDILEKMISNVVAQSKRKALPRPGETTITKGSPEYKAMRSQSAKVRVAAAKILQKDIEAREAQKLAEEQRRLSLIETPEETIALNRIAKRKARADRRAIDPRVQAENAKQGKKTGKKFKLTRETIDGELPVEEEPLPESRDLRQLEMDFGPVIYDQHGNQVGKSKIPKKLLDAQGNPIGEQRTVKLFTGEPEPSGKSIIVPEHSGKGQRFVKGTEAKPRVTQAPLEMQELVTYEVISEPQYKKEQSRVTKILTRIKKRFGFETEGAFERVVVKPNGGKIDLGDFYIEPTGQINNEDKVIYVKQIGKDGKSNNLTLGFNNDAYVYTSNRLFSYLNGLFVDNITEYRYRTNPKEQFLAVILPQKDGSLIVYRFPKRSIKFEDVYASGNLDSIVNFVESGANNPIYRRGLYNTAADYYFRIGNTILGKQLREKAQDAMKPK